MALLGCKKLRSRSPKVRVPQTCTTADCRPGDSLAFCPVRGDVLGNLITTGCLPWSFRHRFCHFAIVAHYSEVCVFESTHDAGLGNCLDAKVRVSGVQVHPLHERLELHLGPRRGRVFRLPLTHAAKVALFDRHVSETHIALECQALLGTGYDARAAFGARTLLGGATFRLYDQIRRRPPSGHEDDFLFCSEFVLKVYKGVGLLPSLWDGQWIKPGNYHPKAAAGLLQRLKICSEPEEILL